MFKRFQGFVLSSAAIALLLIGNIGGISPYCWFITYEPDLPKCLQR